MNIQLFGYDDGYYYGQCKLIFEAETVADNGKTVTISDGTNTKSAILADTKCEFIVPCRTSWAVTLLDGSTTEWTGRVECGYGDCIHTMLADGYKPVVHNEILTLDQIASQADIDTKVSSASAVKTLNSNLTANSQSFRFAYRNNKYGYFTKEAGTDVFHPFRLADVYYLGTGTSFNIRTKVPEVDYTKLTSANFIVGCNSVGNAGIWKGSYISACGDTITQSYSVNKSYNSSNGVLNISSWNPAPIIGGGSVYYSIGAQNASFFAYLVTGEIKNRA